MDSIWTTLTFSVDWSVDSAVSGNSVIMSTSPAVSAATRASGLLIVWKITPSTAGLTFQWSLTASSWANSPIW